MNPVPQKLRILLVGTTLVPELADFDHAALPDIELALERAPDLPAALEHIKNEKSDAILIEQSSLPAPQAEWLDRLCESNGGADVIVLADRELPLATVSDWLNRVRHVRLLLKPLDPSALVSLLRRLGAWRTAPADARKKEDQNWLNVELATLTIQAMFDSLTGLLRREEMVQRGSEELNRSQRTSQHLCCIMCDIDHFKRVNDTFGHHAGDRTLQRVASLLTTGNRPYDLVGRMGGEEFMLIIPGPTLEEGQRIAERIRLTIQDYPWADENLPPVTLSFGVAELLLGPFNDFLALSRAADAALYDAKNHGRNQVCLMDTGPHPDPQPEPEGDDSRPRLLIVDDTVVYLRQLIKLLGKRYQVESTTDPREALAWVEQRPFDMVLADQNMPEMKGHELLIKVKSLQPACARLIMTSHGELSSALQAINEAEVYRYILKSWSDEDLLLTIYQALESRAMAERLREADRETVKTLADAIELRDRSTQGHYHRVAEYAQLIGRELHYSKKRLQTLEYAAWLHDVGKVGIPDAILKKKDSLTPQEEKILREHTLVGASLIAGIEHLAPMASIIHHHHERFDGHGYPDGLAGHAIPEEARIIAIANAYDGLMTPHRGRPALSPNAARNEILQGKGSHFDPLLVVIFERVCLRHLVDAFNN